MRILSALFASSAVIAAVAYSQAPGDGRHDRHPHDRPDPVIHLFDTDDDGKVSAAEIENAGVVLAALDADGDGVLNSDELPRPPRPEGHGCRGQGRPGPPPPPRDGHAGPPRDDRPAPPPRGNRPELEADEQEITDAPQGTVLFRGGHETDPRDRGRPVALIAAALGVESQVFRDAFSGVTPARGGHPTAAQAQANKQVLMDALGPHGITNERLDEVSNFYRYQPESGGLWSHNKARATAVIEDGQVVAINVTDAGAGYTAPPTVTVAGYENVKVEAKIEFSTKLAENGRLTSLEVVD